MLMPCFIMADVIAIMFILADVIANIVFWAVIPIYCGRIVSTIVYG